MKRIAIVLAGIILLSLTSCDTPTSTNSAAQNLETTSLTGITVNLFQDGEQIESLSLTKGATDTGTYPGVPHIQRSPYSGNFNVFAAQTEGLMPIIEGDPHAWLRFGYNADTLAPWEVATYSGTSYVSTDDYFLLEFFIEDEEDGLIPVVCQTGSVTFTEIGELGELVNGSFTANVQYIDNVNVSTEGYTITGNFSVQRIEDEE